MSKIILNVTGMTCSGCEHILEKAISSLEGVSFVNASQGKSKITVEFSLPCTEETIINAIRSAGYDVTQDEVKPVDLLAIVIIIFGLYVIAVHMGWTEIFQKIPTIDEQKIGYIALFVIGLLTSVHCIAMCGGLNLAQSISSGDAKPFYRSIMYNLGRLTGYTFVGGVLGFIGEKAAVTLQVRGLIGFAAGIFMLLMGINMLGIPLTLRLFPNLTLKLSRRIQAFGRHGSFAIGLGNSLMPCGPLQSMQIYAIACGSMLTGALSMFSFCLGTIPLVLLFGFAAGLMKIQWRQRMLHIGSVILIIMGLVMIQNNLVLTGFMPTLDSHNNNVLIADIYGDAQYITTNLHSNGYDDIQVTAGIPVVWTVEVEKENLNGCNNKIVLPAFNREISFSDGKAVIEFTPEKEGTYTYSCWMGMLKNTITVVAE